MRREKRGAGSANKRSQRHSNFLLASRLAYCTERMKMAETKTETKGNKKKRRFLSYQQQAEVIKKLKSGVPRETVMRDYGIGKSFCYKLYHREEMILSKISSNATLSRKTAKPCEDKILDEVMIVWFQQLLKLGDPVSGPILQEKARVFNEKLNLSSTFKVCKHKIFNTVLLTLSK